MSARKPEERPTEAVDPTAPKKLEERVDDLPVPDADGENVKGGLLPGTSFHVNTLTFSSNATGKG